MVEFIIIFLLVVAVIIMAYTYYKNMTFYTRKLIESLQESGRLNKQVRNNKQLF